MPTAESAAGRLEFGRSLPEDHPTVEVDLFDAQSLSAQISKPPDEEADIEPREITEVEPAAVVSLGPPVPGEYPKFNSFLTARRRQRIFRNSFD